MMRLTVYLLRGHHSSVAQNLVDKCYQAWENGYAREGEDPDGDCEPFSIVEYDNNHFEQVLKSCEATISTINRRYTTVTPLGDEVFIRIQQPFLECVEEIRNLFKSKLNPAIILKFHEITVKGDSVYDSPPKGYVEYNEKELYV